MPDLRSTLEDDPVALGYFLVRQIEVGLNMYDNTRDCLDLLADTSLFRESPTELDLLSLQRKPKKLRLRLLTALINQGDLPLADMVAAAIRKPGELTISEMAEDVVTHTHRLNDREQRFIDEYPYRRMQILDQKGELGWKQRRELRHFMKTTGFQTEVGDSSREVISVGRIEMSCAVGDTSAGVALYEKTMAKPRIMLLDKITASVTLAGWNGAGGVDGLGARNVIDRPATNIEVRLAQLEAEVAAGGYAEGDGLLGKVRSRKRITAAIGDIATSLKDVQDREQADRLSQNISSLREKLLG